MSTPSLTTVASAGIIRLINFITWKASSTAYRATTKMSRIARPRLVASGGSPSDFHERNETILPIHKSQQKPDKQFLTILWQMWVEGFFSWLLRLLNPGLVKRLSSVASCKRRDICETLVAMRDVKMEWSKCRSRSSGCRALEIHRAKYCCSMCFLLT